MRWRALIGVCFYAGTAIAHGTSSSMEEDVCAQKLGDHYVHFNAYQPTADPTGHYCNEVPSATDTLIVVDLEGSGLRQNGVALNITRLKQGAEPEAVLVLPQKPYLSGVVTTQIKADAGEVYRVQVSTGVPGSRPVGFRLVVKPVGGIATQLTGAWPIYLILTIVLLYLGRSWFLRRSG